MRPVQIFISILVSGLALWTECKSVKEITLFSDWFSSIPFWTLCILIIIFLMINFRQYLNCKKIFSFIPLSLCATSLITIVWYQKMRAELDNSPTKFTASTSDIGSDGGFILDFKKNGHVKAEKNDHWTLTYYWGNYSQKHDTINLDIPLNFKLGRQALLTDDSLHFIGDTAKFRVLKQ